MPEIQERRENVQIHGGLKLHQYANLYLHARNPMLSKRRSEAHSLCVLRISTECRRIKDTVIADRNASSKYVRFFPVEQANRLDLKAIYARDWKHPDDQIAEWRHKSKKCAEFLVPRRVPSQYLRGAWVVDEEAKAVLIKQGFTLPIEIDADLFFH